MRKYFVFCFLAWLRLIAKTFWRVRQAWVGPVPDDPWSGIRLVCFLHHTSLFEWLFIGAVPLRFVWRVAAHGVVPAAEKTIRRPLIGIFFKAIAAHVGLAQRVGEHKN